MISIFRFLLHNFSFRELNSISIIIVATIVSIIELSVFAISAGALEYLLFNRISGLNEIINYVNYFNLFIFNENNILLIGLVACIFTIFLNFVLLKIVKNKITELGILFQSKLLKPYIDLPINFNLERNTRIDLKVFAESLVVVTESCFLQLYLALVRSITLLIYVSFGLWVIEFKFLMYSFILILIFSLSSVIFSLRIKDYINRINVIGEKRLRLLSSTLKGRIDFVLYGLPQSLIKKLNIMLSSLMQNKLSVMTEVHKPRIVIEGTLFFVIISLAFYQAFRAEFIISSSAILIILLLLRLIPILQQIMSHYRTAGSVGWAISDIDELLRKNKVSKPNSNNELLWKCHINFDAQNINKMSIMVKSEKYQNFDEIILTSGIVNILSGPSGSGKTSLLKSVIESLQKHQDWDGCLKKITSYLPQNINIFLISFWDNIRMKNSDINISDDELLKIGFSQEWIKKFDDHAVKINEIASGGEAQRLSFLRSISSKSKRIFLFDEPTSALDKKSADFISNKIEALARKGNFIVVVSHNDLAINEEYKKLIQL